MKIISRSEAKAAGLKRYFTGEPCKRGHVAERFYSTKDCVQCNAGNRDKWRTENPEKNKEAIQRRYENDYQKLREQGRKRDRRYLTKKKCAEVSANIDRGRQDAATKGIVMDEATAFDVFKANDMGFAWLDDEGSLTDAIAFAKSEGILNG